MRIFWRINYFLSFFLLFELLAFFAQIYITNDWYHTFCDAMVISMGTNIDMSTDIIYIYCFNDYLQLFVCGTVLIFIKAERTKRHKFYLLILLLLMLVKTTFHTFFIAGSGGIVLRAANLIFGWF